MIPRGGLGVLTARIDWGGASFDGRDAGWIDLGGGLVLSWHLPRGGPHDATSNRILESQHSGAEPPRIGTCGAASRDRRLWAREGFSINSWHQDMQTGGGADALLLRPGLATALYRALRSHIGCARIVPWLHWLGCRIRLWYSAICGMWLAIWVTRSLACSPAASLYGRGGSRRCVV